MNSILATVFFAMTSVNLHGQTIKIPDPLVLSSGEKIASVADWQAKRRPELLELFRTHVYGRAPLERPQNLKFDVREVRTDAMNGAATRKRITVSFAGHGGRGAVNVVLFAPNRVQGAVPCFVLVNNRGSKHSDPTRVVQSPFWPAEDLIARGYAAAVFNNTDLDPDVDDGFKNGVHGIFDAKGKRRSPDAWGSIAAWAWGASRVMDYLQSDPQINPKSVAVVGHSRGGKAALWAGAQDERFAMVISNNSGSTGAALARGKQGEKIAKINAGFPHWFNENYKKYGDKESELPVDQHQLLALVAPRLLYIASATDDLWADPEAEWMSSIAAAPVYHLFGLRGPSASVMPPPETPVLNGHIGYHLRTGKHDLNRYDWARFMDFADKHWR